MAYRVGLRGFVCISNPHCRAWLLAACLALCAGGGPAAAQAGLKVVPNFTYNWPDCPSSNPNCAKDARSTSSSTKCS